MRKVEGLPRTPPALDPRYRSGALFGRLWRGYLRPYAGLVALAFGLMVIEGGTFGALSYLIRPLFDQVLAPGGQNLLLWVAFAILGLFVVRAITALLSRGIMTTVAQKSSTAMQVDLLRHILTLDQGFFQSTPPGALIERVQGDTIAVQGVWSAIIVGVGRDTVAVLSLFGVALSIAPLWTLAALVGVPLLVVPVALVQRYIRAKSRHLREQAGLRTTRLDEIFHGIQAIKLNRMEAFQSERFRRIARAIVRAEVRMMLGRAAMPSLIDITTGIGFFAVLLLGGREIASGSRTIG
ncbi:MAG: ABC transporter transmembrane domain-containing protein, partial [Pseudorhodobacter sp.]|nr:ABC transporter transmembrane domain-containing protein [Pseudorhodobacter sp.]